MTTAFFRNVAFRICIIALAWVAESNARADVPTIVEQPLPLTVGPGDRAGFAVSATGTEPLTFQWFRNGVAVADGTHDVLLLESAVAGDAGDYSVAVSNAEGVARSTQAKLEVAPYTREWIDPNYGNGLPHTIGKPVVAADGTVFTIQPERVYRLTQAGAIDSSFNSSWEVNGDVWGVRHHIVLAQPLRDGGVLFIEEYGSDGRVLARRLVRLRNDGSQDPSLSFRATADLDGSILLESAGKLLVTIAGQLVRLNFDGSVDSTFSAEQFMHSDGTVQPASIARLDPEGRVFACDGTHVFRLLPDGRRDPAFRTFTVDARVDDLAVSAEGKLWIGTFGFVSGGQQLAGRIRRLLSSGEIDPSWHESPLIDEWYRDWRMQLIAQPDGRLLVAGFGRITRPSDEAGRSFVRNSVLRLNADGGLDQTFAPPLVSSWPLLVLLPGGQQAIFHGRADEVPPRRLNLATLGPIAPPRILKVTSEASRVLAGDDVKIEIVAVGPGPLTVSGGSADASTTGDSVVLRSLQSTPQIQVSGAGGVAIRPSPVEVVPSVPRIVRMDPVVTARLGQEARLPIDFRGTQPYTFSLRKNGVEITSVTYRTTGIEYTIPVNGAADAGTYVFQVSNELGVARAESELVIAPTSQLSNLSVRGRAGSGDEVIIVGFVVENHKRALIQALGPELATWGVTGALENPQATLIGVDGTRLENDDAEAGIPTVDPIYSRLGAPGLWYGTRSSQIWLESVRGINTFVVSGVGGTTGVVLAHIFDADLSTDRFLNLSARVVAGTGDDTAIVGFIVTGDASKKVLIRCVGPGLSGTGIARILPDPSLSLIDQASHETIAQNDDWGAGSNRSELAEAMRQVGAFPLADGSKDAAILTTLAPGRYTATTAGANGTTGVVLLEVYDVP